MRGDGACQNFSCVRTHDGFVVEAIMAPAYIGTCLEWPVQPNIKRLELASGTRGHPEQFHIVLCCMVFKGIRTVRRVGVQDKCSRLILEVHCNHLIESFGHELTGHPPGWRVQGKIIITALYDIA